MTTECMDFCQHLAGQGMSFNLQLSMGLNQKFWLSTTKNTSTFWNKPKEEKKLKKKESSDNEKEQSQ